MATLHMEVDSVRGVQQKIVAEKGTMESSLSAVAASVSGAIGSAWQGPSAEQFADQFNDLNQQIVQQLTALQELSERLQAEIQQWEDMAASMG